MHWTGTVSFSNQQQARKMALLLLEKRLVACAQIIPTIDSYYWWKKKQHHTKETLLLFKTRKGLVKETIQTIVRNHLYALPVVETWEIGKTNAPAYWWIEQETQPGNLKRLQPPKKKPAKKKKKNRK